jgi:hypothetical protein
MSTKTNFKRIALVAISALGIGVLTSVAPASAAYGGAVTAADVSITSQTGTATANIGICDVVADEKATVTTAATLTFTNATSSNGYIKVLSGPAAWTGATGFTVNAAATTVTMGTTGSATLKASAVGTVKVTAFNAADTAVEAYTITVVAACAGDAYSAADSYFRAVASASVTAGLITTNVDDSGSTSIPSAGKAYIAMALNDAYGDNLATQGALVVSATNGALVNIDADSAGTSSTAVKATVASDAYVRVDTPTAGTPVTTTVTVTFNGTVVGTKTITLRGHGKSIVITDITVGKSGTAYTDTSTAGAGSFLYQWKDAAGNVVPGGAVSATAATGLTTLVTSVVGGGSVGVGNTVARAAVSPTTVTGVATDFGDGKFTCTGSTKSGSATLAVAGYNANLDLVVSAPFTVNCGGVLDTWTISLDKASYNTGDIGTLTVTGKDANGAMVTDIATLTGITGNVTIGGGATFVTTPVNADTFTKGVKTYKFLVGNDEGSYAGSVTITGATDTTAKTVQYKVVSGTATVSNADVLKSIVALIASINKQIQALQKLILKR